jgi:superfamily II DNA or RNA helicase
MFNVYISSQIYIKAKDLPLNVRKMLKERYTFTWKEFRNGASYENKINLMNTKKFKDNFWICLPPNLDYLIPILDEYKLDYLVSDNRCKITLENPPKFKGTLRDYQQEVLDMMSNHKYNCVLSLGTGQGKSYLASYLSTHLRTTVLFSASKTSYITSFINEIKKNIEDWQDNFVEINSEWLKNPIIKPIMVCSIQVLHRPEILEALKNKVGCIVSDEIHNSMLGNKHIEGIYGLNAKYRINLSATPYSKVKGFIEAGCSPNIVTLEHDIDFTIKYQPVTVSLPDVVSEYKQCESFHDKKKLIFGVDEYLPSLVNFIKDIINLDRQVLLFCTDKTFQENISKLLNSVGVSSICLNSNTKKKDIETILSNYEKGKLKVLVSGASSVEALSLYKLSVFLDIDLSDNENNVEQKIGRLKRFKEEVSDKSKIYIKIIYDNMTNNKFKFVIKPLVTGDRLSKYVSLENQIKLEGFTFREAFEEIFTEEIHD